MQNTNILSAAFVLVALNTAMIVPINIQIDI